MKVLHVIASLDPAAGGPPAIAARLAAAQAGLGHDVGLLSYASPASAEAMRASYASIPGFDRVRHVEVAGAGPLEPLLARRAAATVERLLDAGHADVVHLHNVWERLLVVAASAARRRGVPYFVLLNGMLDPWSLRQRATKKRLALALGYRRMLDRAAALHLGNDDERRLIAPLRLRAPGVVIPNGIFLEEVEPLPPATPFRDRLPALGGAPYVLFLSRLHYKKGLDHLAEAFALVARRHPDVHLVVAGPDGGAGADFRERVGRHGLGPRVHLPGPLYGVDKLSAFAGASCFCLPSRQEGFSVAITEALACGVPAVISPGCHFPEVVEAGAGIVAPLDPPAIAGALSRILADAGLARTMSRAGRELVRARYTWPRIAESAVRHYEEARRRTAAPRAIR